MGARIESVRVEERQGAKLGVWTVEEVERGERGVLFSKGTIRAIRRMRVGSSMLVEGGLRVVAVSARIGAAVLVIALCGACKSTPTQTPREACIARLIPAAPFAEAVAFCTSEHGR